MARNAVQFHKGFSEPTFGRHYGTDERCRAVVVGHDGRRASSVLCVAAISAAC